MGYILVTDQTHLPDEIRPITKAAWRKNGIPFSYYTTLTEAKTAGLQAVANHKTASPQDRAQAHNVMSGYIYKRDYFKQPIFQNRVIKDVTNCVFQQNYSQQYWDDVVDWLQSETPTASLVAVWHDAWQYRQTSFNLGQSIFLWYPNIIEHLHVYGLFANADDAVYFTISHAELFEGGLSP